MRTLGSYCRLFITQNAPGKLIVSDGMYAWILGASNCIMCFERSYDIWAKGRTVQGDVRYINDTARIQALDNGDIDQIPFDSLTDELFPAQVDLSSGAISSIVLHRWEGCNNHDSSAPLIVKEAMGRAALVHEQIFVNKQPKKIRIPLHERFGVVSWFGCYEGSGLVPDIVSGKYVATLLSMHHTQGIGQLLLVGGLDEDPELAKIKAMMEFLERCAYFNHTGEAAGEGVPRISMKKFSALCDSYLHDKLSVAAKHSSAKLGVDVFTGAPVAVPNLLTYLSIDPAVPSFGSCSGSGAHVSTRRAFEAALLELIERDACLRWWCAPEIARVFAASSALQKRLDDIVCLLQTHIAEGHTFAVRLYVLPSAIGLPVVMATATSADPTIAPAFLVGSSCAYDLEVAAEKAVDELCCGVLSFLAQWEKPSGIDEMRQRYENFSSVQTPQDHLLLYSYPGIVKDLSFLPHLLAQKNEEADFAKCPQNLEGVLSALKQRGFDCYAVDVTPRFVQDAGVRVMRAVVPGLYPLVFGTWPLFDTKKFSRLSCADKLPHCFT